LGGDEQLLYIYLLFWKRSLYRLLVLTFIAVTIVAVYVYGGEWGYVFTPQGKNNVLITLVIVTIISLVFHSIGFFQEGQQQKVVNERLRKEKAQAELNALKTQVDPHFLFNSFNVLSGLIDENPSQAQKFLGGLSKIYRYILEHRDEGLVTLEEELAFAQQYLTLQRIRFEEGIKLSLDVDDSDLLKKLPALSLQLLLENAIKHNGFNADEPLKILIETSSDTLKVSNNKQARIKLSEGSGLGLKNIAKRYALHKVNGFEIDDTTDTFTVQIPLIV